MSFDYINEAFRRLNSLTEDTFDTSLNGLNALADFREEDDVTDLAKVIDPEAETEDAISDSYIGKVIINCNVCHSHIFEAKEDVVVDEDGLVNPEMQCPYCGEMSGFTVVGEIQPYETKNSETDAESDAEPSEIETNQEAELQEGIFDKFKKDDTKYIVWRKDSRGERPWSSPMTKKEADEWAKSHKTNGVEYTVKAYDAEEVRKARDASGMNDDLKEAFRDTPINDSYKMLKDFLVSKGLSVSSKQAIAYAWSVIDLFESGDIEVTQESLEKWFADTQQNYPEDLEIFNDTLDESVLTEGKIIDNIKKVATRVGADAATIIRCFTELGEMAANIGNKGEYKNTKLNDLMTYVEDKAVLKALLSGNEAVMNGLTKEDIEELENDIAEYEAEQKAKKEKSSEKITESIDELSLTANGTHIEVDEDEDGRVTLVAEPAENNSGDMQISPVSDETIAEIENNNSEVVDEEPAEDTPEEPEEVDVDIEDVEEADLDELGESYLKSTYRNVESFKTNSVSTTDSSLIVEGTVTFTSGVKKNTGFVFEAYSVDAQGKLKFIGSNKHLSESADAFTLTGSVEEKKFIPESLSYNYNVSDEVVSGTVTKK